MKRAIGLAMLIGFATGGPAAAYEYTLQFTPAPGNVSHLDVAGYKFVSGKVVGNCSYDITTSGSGRDPRSYTTHYPYTCTWDLHGTYVSQVTGAPTAPTPISSVSGLTIYAKDARGDTTGVDANGGVHGFVNSKSAQYAWGTPSGGYLFLPSQQKVDIPLTVQSVGDLALVDRKVVFTSLYGKLKVKSNGCLAPGVAPGASCVIVVTYDPTAIAPGDNPYTAYDHVTVGLTSNSGLAPIWSETIETPIPGG